MSLSSAFMFNAKQWLGDEAVLLMDWDTRAVHLHLMCLAWQQKEPGTLPNDARALRRWVGNPHEKVWAERLFPQLLRAWRVSEDGKTLRQEGLIREAERQRQEAAALAAGPAAAAEAPAKGKRKTKKQLAEEAALAARSAEGLCSLDGDVAAPDSGSGFALGDLLSSSAQLFERVSEQERANIWTMGTALLRDNGFGENQVRRFLGKQIQDHGEKRVAEAIAQLSLKKLPPAEAKSYFVAVLKGVETRKKRRGGVAL
jgi:hypothetical protein